MGVAGGTRLGHTEDGGGREERGRAGRSARPLSTNERIGAAFGRPAAISSEAGLLCVYNGASLIDVYDLTTVARRASLQFGDDVRYVRFSDDGTRLVVVTADQMVRLFDPKALGSR